MSALERIWIDTFSKNDRAPDWPTKPVWAATEYTRTDLSQAAVAAALEAAAAMLNDRGKLEQDNFGLNRATQNFFRARDMVRDMITPAQHDALAAHIAAEVANARADTARDAALVEAAGTLEDQALDAEAQAKRFRGGSDPWADRTARSRALRSSAAAILALRDKPAPGVTPKIEVKFTWAKGDEEFWVHLKSPDGKSAGFNLGNPKGMIATALLRAIAGGGDE